MRSKKKVASNSSALYQFIATYLANPGLAARNLVLPFEQVLVDPKPRCQVGMAELLKAHRFFQGHQAANMTREVPFEKSFEDAA